MYWGYDDGTFSHPHLGSNSTSRPVQCDTQFSRYLVVEVEPQHRAPRQLYFLRYSYLKDMSSCVLTFLRVSCYSLQQPIPVPASAGSDAGMGVAQTYTACSRRPHPADNILPPSRSPTVMSLPSQGTSGPSGHAGSRPAFGQPVSRNHTTPRLALIKPHQTLPERSIPHQLRRLTVRLLVNAFNLRADILLGG